jgi:hypothetical protein
MPIQSNTIKHFMLLPEKVSVSWSLSRNEHVQFAVGG